MSSAIGSQTAISTADAAALLSVSTTTLHTLVHGGHLRPLAKAPGIRGAYIFDRADVEALAAKRNEATK